jgi:hypothetical protein
MRIDDAKSWGFLMLETRTASWVRPLKMLAPQPGHDFCAVSAAGGAQHTRRSPAISKSGVSRVTTLKSKGCRLKPKIPIFETEPHVFIEANARVKNTSPDKAASIGNIH